MYIYIKETKNAQKTFTHTHMLKTESLAVLMFTF